MCALRVISESFTKVVTKVHGIEGRLEKIKEMMTRHGFDVTAEQNQSLSESTVHNLYARKEGQPEHAGTVHSGEQLTSQREEPRGVERSIVSAGELRDYLRKQLPDHMIPSALVFVKEIPLTRHGKVDRLALPAPEEVEQSERAGVLAPSTPVEEIVVGIWREVLKGARVSLDENFFEIGGHSLLATQVISRIRKAFSIEMPLRTLFERPTVRELSGKIEEAMRAGQSVHCPGINRASRAGPIPLSYAQQRLWFLDQLESGSAFYNSPAAVRLKGALKVEALERALSEIVRRHEVLRTTFKVIDGQPAQVIHKAKAIALPVKDLSDLAAQQRETEAARLAQEEARRLFDLERGPLFRAALLKLKEEEHIILLTMHHIASDGWSTAVLIKEVAALYESYSKGKASPLEDLAVQYADYAVWQREWLQGEVLNRQLSYWKQQLEQAPAALELPTDRPRPPVQSYCGARQGFRLSDELSRGLQDLSRREGATLFMTLLAAFQVLLSRYSNQEDVSVGTPIAGRQQRETEGLIGFFVNMLVMRAQVQGGGSFRELLQQVREMSLGAYAHQEMPFEKLVEEMGVERELSRSPLFQVLFVLQNAPMPPLSLSGLTLTIVEVESSTSKFDLLLAMTETTEGLAGTIEYNTNLFDASTITRMLGHFENLLEAIVADPSQRISNLPLLTNREREQLLIEWNDTYVDYQTSDHIHQLFEKQVESVPQNVALVFEGVSLTYGELNRRANQLANHLRALGIGPDVLVGICVNRSIEMVVGLLGILKAGGAYVPLDPSYPQERLSWMLEDAGCKVALTQQSLNERLPKNRVQLIALDADWDKIATNSEENCLSRTTDENLAYCIYTSGSTGQPKGALNTHGAIRNRLLWMQEAYQLRGADHVLQKTPYSFDVSVWEFFWPLMTGARMVLASPEGHRDAAYLIRLISEQQVTTIHFVPSMLQAFLREEGVESCRSLRRVICSGEALPPELQETFHARLGAELHNLYGPTEAAIDVTFWACKPESGQRLVPIGRPIANTQIYLLDQNMQPVPNGTTGELYIGGVNLARGYLNQPELTAEKFVPNPFSAAAGSRLYRTGDLARYLADGQLAYLGRTDHQVKLRGFRIELGEIEAALAKHPSVSESVVIVSEEAASEKRLVGYVVGAGASIPEGGELRDYLKEKLPEYMVPSSFMALDAIPLSANGKVDRRALPKPSAAQRKMQAADIVPRTDLEKVIANVWQEALNLEPVGIYDNFFDLGGHSLLVSVVRNKLREVLDLDISLIHFYKHPTIKSLAEYLSREQAQQASFTHVHKRALKQREARERQREKMKVRSR